MSKREYYNLFYSLNTLLADIKIRRLFIFAIHICKVKLRILYIYLFTDLQKNGFL